MDRQTVGRLGENLAARYLVSKGYRLLERNFRARQYGEVDIICLSPDAKTLIFVEVKTRIGTVFGRPEEAVNKHKLRELKKMADYYFNLHPNLGLSLQIDVLAISLHPDNSVESLKHLENITL